MGYVHSQSVLFHLCLINSVVQVHVLIIQGFVGATEPIINTPSSMDLNRILISENCQK